MQIHAFRLKPGQDLKQELISYTEKHNIQAGFMMTCVGSLQKAAIRLANQCETTIYQDKFEIVSLTGTIAPHHTHLHISISDTSGKTIGGHLMEGSLIYTTAEIVLGETTELQFISEQCELSGYHELVIKPRTDQ